MNLSYKTAITRTKINAPMKFLSDNGLLNGRCLDYGCGKGFSADQLGLDKYDPYFYPDKTEKKYDVVTCNYVLNVLEKKDQVDVLEKIYYRLRDNGIAYISVRRDVKIDGYTKKNTYQCNVDLDAQILYNKSSRYAIYVMTKGELRHTIYKLSRGE